VADSGLKLEDVILFIYEGRIFRGRIDAHTAALKAGYWHLERAWVPVRTVQLCLFDTRPEDDFDGLRLRVAGLLVSIELRHARPGEGGASRQTL